MLSADALWLVSLSPVALVLAVLAGCLVGGAIQDRRTPSADPQAVATYWALMRADQQRRSAKLGTPEPAIPQRATISLYTATLPEVLEYLRDARIARAYEHNEYLTLIGGLRA